MMAQAFNSVMNGGQLPPNCVLLKLNVNGGMQQQQYGQFQQQPYNMQQPMNIGNFMSPQQQPMNFLPPSPFMYDQGIPGGLVPYQPNGTGYSQYPPYIGYNGAAQPNNYPIVPYQEQHQYYDIPRYRGRKSRGQSHHRERSRAQHSNIYEEESFDSQMRNLDWSGLFNQHGQKPAIGYRRSHASSSSSTSKSSSSRSSTTSDETIRRVSVSRSRPTDVNRKQQENYQQQQQQQHYRRPRQYDGDYSRQRDNSHNTNNTYRSNNNRNRSSTHRKHRKNDLLPFEYSSEFIPLDKEKQSKKSTAANTNKKGRVSEDDVFIIKTKNNQQQKQQPLPSQKQREQEKSQAPPSKSEKR
ncbi:unnamed protein product [Didymodactylos carnosus]|uniref:Uncharacterized protein n=1 Tax=Didymodactylos carnosus TaxID=1234261 RepID=A0A813YZN6_9BILA|nr:unnamed protein product [Didymodactylos carnosus]CAF1114105.1 unnamed protein product [Didymodactylos carnosus]CAF3675731.1 unnamed protein product [Didymodactylos carnosus]CAF3883259.1 unnamed protein product [Didymodactylos carnosus]